jgi:hypothetical protein
MKQLTPIKAIRAKCLDCSGGSYKEVEDCLIPDCPIYLYRLGRRPNEQERQYIIKLIEKEK